MPDYDPNVYALSIQLQLESSQALAALQQVESTIIGLESQLSDAAKQVLGSISMQTDQLDTALSGVSTSAIKIDKLGGSIDSKLTDISKTTTQIGDDHSTQIKGLQKELKHWEEVYDIHLQMAKIAEDELKKNKEFNEGVQRIVRSIDAKNQGHDEQNALMDQSNDRASLMDDYFNRINNSVRNVRRSHHELILTMGELHRLITFWADAMDVFYTANFRAYGSQTELLRVTRDISQEHQILRHEALAAYRILGDLATPREEINKYAGAIGMTHRVTGVAIDSLATYTLRLRQSGMDAAGAADQFTKTTHAMRMFGLSTDDVNRTLNNTRLTGAQLAFMFDDLNAAANVDQIKLYAAGLAKNMGMTAEVSNEMIDGILSDFVRMQKFADMAGLAEIRTVEDFGTAIARSGQVAMQEIDRITRETADPAARKQEMAVVAEALGFGTEQAMLFAAQMQRASENLNITIKSGADFERVMQEVAKKGVMGAGALSDQFETANETLVRELQITRDLILNLSRGFSEWLASGLIPVVKWVNSFIQTIDNGTAALRAWWNALPKTGDFLTDLVTGLQAAKAWIEQETDNIIAFVTTAWDNIWGKIVAAFEVMRPMLSKAWEMALNGLAAAWDKFWPPTYAAIKAGLAALWDNYLYPGLQWVGEQLANAMSWLWAKAWEYGNKAIEAGVSAAVSWIFQQAILAGPRLAMVGFRILDFIVEGFVTALVAVNDAVAAAYGAFWNAITTNDWAGLGRTVIEYFVDGMMLMFNPLKLVGWMYEQLSGAFDAANWDGLGGSIVRGILSGLEGGWADVETWFADSWEWIKSKFNPFAKASPSMVDNFNAGFATIADSAAELGGELGDKWKHTGRMLGRQFRGIADDASSLTELGMSDIDIDVASLTRTADAIVYSATALQGAVSGLDIDITMLDDGMTATADILQQYSTMWEEAADRINTAIVTKAVPAMLAADRAKVLETARQHTIATVQVMDRREGGDATASQQLLALRRIETILERLDGTVKTASEPRANDSVSEIAALLQEHLPEMAKSDFGSVANRYGGSW